MSGYGGGGGGYGGRGGGGGGYGRGGGGGGGGYGGGMDDYGGESSGLIEVKWSIHLFLFFSAFLALSKLYATPHAPCHLLYEARMLIGRWLVSRWCLRRCAPLIHIVLCPFPGQTLSHPTLYSGYATIHVQLSYARFTPSSTSSLAVALAPSRLPVSPYPRLPAPCPTHCPSITASG